MALASGTRLGSHEIVGAIGAGGMGEVYRARDSRLQRDVAIKVLPQTLALDADMLARFGREAQVLAQLNHPNIAAVYGVEEADGIRALVMELVDGPTLSDVMAAATAEGRTIPVNEVVDIARQIASGIEAAHEQGIIHRDLKPGNIKLRPDGTVKVLDFGLAKALDPTAAAPGSAVFTSPTLSIRATQAGLILGTAAYMSPEQAKGKPVDRRADIWAFGVVLYEMLSGRTMYTGETVSEVLARVIEREPDLSTVPPETPRRLRDLLRRCLVKDPRNRLRDIGEARLVLEDLAARPGEAEGPAGPVPVPAAPARWRRALPWGLAAAAMLTAGAAAWAPWRDIPARPLPVHVTVDLGIQGNLGTWMPFAVSPDGSTVAFVVAATTGGEQGVIHVRRLDETEATAIASTVGARNPFFSPDGQWIAFFADRKLKKVGVSGGAAMTLCEVRSDRGGSWGEDGTIVFAADNRGGLSRVPAAGGQPEPFSQLDAGRGEMTHRFPHFLPGGAGVLYMAHTGGSGFHESDIVVQRLSDGSRHTVRRGGITPMYLRSGHLAYVQGGTLFVEPLDIRTLKTTGSAFPLVEGVRTNTMAGFSSIAVSATGTAIYVRGGSDDRQVLLQWLTADGKPQPARTAPINANTVSIAPDGQRVALDVVGGTDVDVWIYEPDRDVLTRLTSETTDDYKPVWTPDGQRVAYSVGGDKGKSWIEWRRADASGEPQRLVESSGRLSATSWHPAGRLLAYVENDLATLGNIKILPMEGDEATGWKPGTPSVFLGTAFNEQEPAFSPDGRWLAYMSNQAGRFDVYVRPFPGPGAQVQISTSGGLVPRWSPAGNAIHFFSLDMTPMIAPLSLGGGGVRPEKPRVWVDGRVASRGANRPYDVHPDGKRLLVLQDPQSEKRSSDRLTLLLNAFEELVRKAPRN